MIAPHRFASLRVADLMSTPLTLPSKSTVREAAIFLARCRASAVPIASPAGDFDRLLVESDIHRKLSGVTKEFYTPEEFRTAVPLMGGDLPREMLRDLARVGWSSVGGLARRVQVIGPADSLRAALEIMGREGLSTLPVVEDGRLVGVLHGDSLTLRLVEYALSGEG